MQGPLQQGGKLESRGRLYAIAPGSLVHILDQISGRRILVDTGAAFSIQMAILGIDFIRASRLSVDPAGSKLAQAAHSTSGLVLSGQAVRVNCPQ